MILLIIIVHGLSVKLKHNQYVYYFPYLVNTKVFDLFLVDKIYHNLVFKNLGKVDDIILFHNSECTFVYQSNIISEQFAYVCPYNKDCSELSAHVFETHWNGDYFICMPVIKRSKKTFTAFSVSLPLINYKFNVQYEQEWETTGIIVELDSFGQLNNIIVLERDGKYAITSQFCFEHMLQHSGNAVPSAFDFKVSGEYVSFDYVRDSDVLKHCNFTFLDTLHQVVSLLPIHVTLISNRNIFPEVKNRFSETEFPLSETRSISCNSSVFDGSAVDYNCAIVLKGYERLSSSFHKMNFENYSVVDSILHNVVNVIFVVLRPILEFIFEVLFDIIKSGFEVLYPYIMKLVDYIIDDFMYFIQILLNKFFLLSLKFKIFFIYILYIYFYTSKLIYTVLSGVIYLMFTY